MKAAALSERSQAEEELIKAKNQVRLEEVSSGSQPTAYSTHQGEHWGWHELPGLHSPSSLSGHDRGCLLAL